MASIRVFPRTHSSPQCCVPESSLQLQPPRANRLEVRECTLDNPAAACSSWEQSGAAAILQGAKRRAAVYLRVVRVPPLPPLHPVAVCLSLLRIRTQEELVPPSHGAHICPANPKGAPGRGQGLSSGAASGRGSGAPGSSSSLTFRARSATCGRVRRAAGCGGQAEPPTSLCFACVCLKPRWDGVE